MMPLVFVGIFISILFCGLSLDVGMIELEKTQMQTAADAAAIAEDMNFERESSNINGSDGTFAAAAATSYGYTNGVNNTTVSYISSLSAAPTAGDYAGHHDVVQVTISRVEKTFFMGLLNHGTVTVTANAIASPPPCNYFLGTKNLATPTANLSSIGINTLYAKCPAYVGGNLSVPAGEWWQHFQTYITGSAANSSLLGRVKQGTTFNALPRADPLASMAQPTVGACAHTNYSTAAVVTLNPGVYCGSVNGVIVTPGMTLTAATVTLNPGLYIITGGASWTSSNVTGNGVTLFFTNVAGTTRYGSVILGLGGYNNFTLNAVTGSALGSATASGALAGITFFFDRNWVSTLPQDFTVFGYYYTQGIWYLPSTGYELEVASGTCTGYCGIIADNFSLYNAVLYEYGTDYTLFPGANPMRATSVLVQ